MCLACLIKIWSWNCVYFQNGTSEAAENGSADKTENGSADKTENGSAEKVEKKEADPSLKANIVKQIEYYFGDYNLPRDKFLNAEVRFACGACDNIMF